MPGRAGAWLAAALFGLGAVACGPPSPEQALPLGADATSCGGCHETHHDEWAGSSHAGSARSPVLTAMLPEVEAEWGIVARQTCEGCHAPAHGGEEGEGIGCVSCHAATGNRAARDGELHVELETPLAGPLTDATPTPAHRSRPGAFLASPQLCGTCHELTGPELVEEPTLTEYLASPQAELGIGCMDCHLPESAPGPLSNDSDVVRPTRSHRFVGFDPPWGAAPDEAAAAATRTRQLLDEALDLALEPTEGGVLVTVTNVGAGHAVPTGATFLRDLWVDLERNGEVLAARVITLGDQPMRGDTPVPLLTRADHVVIRSLAAGESREVFVAVGSPVQARLRGRAIRETVIEALALDARAGEVPTHEIEQAALPAGG